LADYHDLSAEVALPQRPRADVIRIEAPPFNFSGVR
jgi:hypothetical protein